MRLGGVLRSGKAGDGYRALHGYRLAVGLDAVQLVQGRSREIAAGTAGAPQDWDLLDDEKIASLAVTPRNPLNPGSLSPAEIASRGYALTHDRP